jgi:hypothetical protein
MAMKYLLVSFAILLDTTVAFVPIAIPHGRLTTTSSTPTTLMMAAIDANDDDATYFEDLELAVHAVTQFGALAPDALIKLADKVDAGADSCLFESAANDDGFLCDKEIADRKDVAEVLRMQAELKLRMEAIAGSSLFVEDVLEEANIRGRDLEMEILSEDGI